MIRDGKWRVDPEAGLVWSAKMKRPIGQRKKGRYHALMLKHPQRVGAVQVSLHRVIWEFVHGPIPLGMQVNHVDGNTSNNSIHNLELTTSAGNIWHAIETGLRPLCAAYGQGEANPRAKLTAEAVREIRALLREGEPQTVIAARWGISQGAVTDINRRRRWSHVA